MRTELDIHVHVQYNACKNLTKHVFKNITAVIILNTCLVRFLQGLYCTCTSSIVLINEIAGTLL